MTTFPFLCPESTYWCASLIWSNEYTLSITGKSFPSAIILCSISRYSVFSDVVDLTVQNLPPPLSSFFQVDFFNLPTASKTMSCFLPDLLISFVV